MRFGRWGLRQSDDLTVNRCLRLFFIILNTFIVHTNSWPSYRFSIPNGKNVPNPCETNGIWTAVGHGKPKVFAPRNPFGDDFLKFGLTWNRRICMMDSDGDGRTNGEELGDPTCEWQKSSQTPLLPAVSHPGVCEPVDSPVCLQRPNQYHCPGPKKFECPAFKRNDTLHFNVSMIQIHVPAKVSSLVCLEVRLPIDNDYYLLAAKPMIDQAKIVDQIQIFACDSGLHSRIYNHPFECGEKPRGDCQSLIGGFSTNEPGICFPQNTGYKIGASGCRQLIVQIRYRNPLLNQALYDNSGISLIYTSNPQILEMGTKLISVTHFTIPSGSKNTAITAEYPQQCSAIQISHPIFITGAFIHMHKFGREQRVELIRNGVSTEIVAEGKDFRAHNLIGNHLHNPIKVLPGDSIRIACWYDTTSSKTPITWGLLSTNEMCSASLLFYPRNNWLQATGTSFKTIPLCKLQTSGEVNGCQFGRLFSAIRQHDVTTTALAHCASERICTNECSSIANIAFTHPCLNGENYELLQSRLTRKFQNLKNFMDTLQLCSMNMSKNTSTILTNPALTGVPNIPKIRPITYPIITGNYPGPGEAFPITYSNLTLGPPPQIDLNRGHTGHMRPLAKELVAATKFQTANRKPALPKWESPKTMHAPPLSGNVTPQKRRGRKTKNNSYLQNNITPPIWEHLPARHTPSMLNSISPSRWEGPMARHAPSMSNQLTPRNIQTSNMYSQIQDPLLIKLASIMKLIENPSLTSRSVMK